MLEVQCIKQQEQLAAAIQAQQSLLQIQQQVSDLVATQAEMESQLYVARNIANESEQERIAAVAALAEAEKQLSLLHTEHASTTPLVTKLQLEVAQLRDRARASSMQEAVGASITSMRGQLTDARAMYSRIEAENTTLAQENERLLCLNAELRTQCELLQQNSNSFSSGMNTSSPKPGRRTPQTPPIALSKIISDGSFF